MARLMPRVDIVIVGMGWTGSIAARELADTGLRIVGLERGRFRDTIPDFTAPNALDELRRTSQHFPCVGTVLSCSARGSAAQASIGTGSIGAFCPRTFG